MPDNPTAAQVRLGGPDEIVAGLPHLLGFHPRESMVALGLRRPSGRICLALRVDLPDRRRERVLAEVVATHLSRAGATAAVLVIVTDQPEGDGAATLPRPRLAVELRAALTRARLDLQDLLCVRRERWTSYLCTEAACCPPGGNPVRPEAASVLAAATVAEGRVVHADRDDLVRLLAPAPEHDEAAWQRRLAESRRRHGRALTTAGGRRAVLAAIEAVVRSRAAGPAPVAEGEQARFCVALAAVDVRDACLRWLDGPLADAAEALWLELTRIAVAPYAAAPATLLALFAYARGDGTFARICAERATRDIPDYPMARLVTESLDHCLPPSAIQQLGACLEAAGGDA